MSWLLWAILSAAAVALSLWHYHRRETPGRGRTLLALLRATSFSLVLLLLLPDPHLPAAGDSPARGPLVILDASLSMNVPAGADESRWERGAVLARERAGARGVLLFGDDARAVHRDSLPDTPEDARSSLLPALQAAAEAGARRVLVITDGAIDDADAVARWLPRLGLEVETSLMGDVVPNRSLAELDVPAFAESGAPVSVRFAVSASGAADDSVRVSVRRDGRVIGRAAVPAPSDQRLATGTVDVRLDAPAEGGWVPLEIIVESDDVVPDDDLRTAWVHVGAEPAGIALISLRPDWEPRWLAPVLEQALGLPLHAFLRGATGQYVRLAGGLEAGVSVPEADVRRAVERAELVVLHGYGIDAPQWAVDAAGSARRILIFPADDAPGLPFEVGPEAGGDFFVAAAAPPSPVAALLGAPDAGVPPLGALRTASAPAGAWAPLLVTRGRQGPPQPLLLAGEAGGRRWAVSLGTGYWQWAFRGGPARDLYTQLWSAMAGWLVREGGVTAQARVRPARRAVPRGEPLAWLAPGLDADSLGVTLTDSTGSVVLDTVVGMTRGDTAYTAAPAPGRYSYGLRAYSHGGDASEAGVVSAEGALTIDAFTPDLLRPRADLGFLDAPPGTVRTGEAGVAPDRGRGTPLHATAWPYILLVLLLAGEWVLRRRWGLR